MKARRIADIIEEMAPLELAYKGDELGFVSGSSNREVSVIGVTWRATLDVLQQAKQLNIEMLIIHEPLFQSEKAFMADPAKLTWSPNKERRELVEGFGLSVYRAHSNLDDAEPGQNTELAARLGLTITGRIPYGRLGDVQPTTLSEFANSVKTGLECPSLLVVGESTNLVSKVAVVAGGGNALADMLELAKREGADVMVSGDIQDSRARYAKELGLSVIDVGGYYSETPGMRAFAGRLERQLGHTNVHYLDSGPPWSIW